MGREGRAPNWRSVGRLKSEISQTASEAPASEAVSRFYWQNCRSLDSLRSLGRTAPHPLIPLSPHPLTSELQRLQIRHARRDVALRIGRLVFDVEVLDAGRLRGGHDIGPIHLTLADRRL